MLSRCRTCGFPAAWATCRRCSTGALRWTSGSMRTTGDEISGAREGEKGRTMGREARERNVGTAQVESAGGCRVALSVAHLETSLCRYRMALRTSLSGCPYGTNLPEWRTPQLGPIRQERSAICPVRRATSHRSTGGAGRRNRRGTTARLGEIVRRARGGGVPRGVDTTRPSPRRCAPRPRRSRRGGRPSGCCAAPPRGRIPRRRQCPSC